MVGASNGREGIRYATRYVPDLVVCDVMMPVMDGLECCRNIKEEISTSHIPVLMLTACSMDEQKVAGYESGADGYISKPFNSAVLRSRIENLLENRRRIKNIWGRIAHDRSEGIFLNPQTDQQSGALCRRMWKMSFTPVFLNWWSHGWAMLI